LADNQAVMPTTKIKGRGMLLRHSSISGFVLYALFSQSVLACSDDSCYPTWDLKRDLLDTCNNTPFLSPANDSRVNLQLLLADAVHTPMTEPTTDDYYKDQGYARVPFPIDLSDNTDNSDTSTEQPASSPLTEQALELGVPNETITSLLTQNNTWEGSRCASNNAQTAQIYLQQLKQAKSIPAAERQSLAQSRLAILQSCDADPAQQSGLLPADISSPDGQLFASYLQGALAFYNADFTQALAVFNALSLSTQPWLKETASYMKGRVFLNSAQQNAFDDMGFPNNEKIDLASLQAAESALNSYLTDYPQGQYKASATGLLRRVYWLMNDQKRLAQAYAYWFEHPMKEANITSNELVQEIDNKLLLSANNTDNIDDPELLSILDLMLMRQRTADDSRPPFTLAQLESQQARFAKQPALYTYLLGAYALYVEKDADKTLRILPETPASTALNYLTFSQQTLRGFALENQEKWSDAGQLWLKLLSQTKQPLQQQQLELALAMNYERSGQLTKVFAHSSPIKTPMVREILLRNVADPTLLRQQIDKPTSAQEHDVALFTLLYKDLTHGFYADFLNDIKKLPNVASTEPLFMGSTYNSQQALALFQWDGKNATDYQCSSLADTVQILRDDNNNPHALNCLGEFVFRHGLDDFPLNSQPDSHELGGTESQFTGTPYSRLAGYQQVMNSKNAAHDDKAYALFRAVNCFAPSGYNSCGTQEIAVEQRKQWFQTLKSRYADTRWGQQLKYYW
jgi:hypothetical protein